MSREAYRAPAAPLTPRGALEPNAGIGFPGGSSAARSRRGPWLGVTLGVVSLDILLTARGLALGLPGTPLQLAASVLGGVAGGYTGRGWGPAGSRPR
jgi:hypothetical protein